MSICCDSRNSNWDSEKKPSGVGGGESQGHPAEQGREGQSGMSAPHPKSPGLGLFFAPNSERQVTLP